MSQDLDELEGARKKDAEIQSMGAEILSMGAEIQSFNREIETTNRGIMALAKELEDRGIALEMARRQLSVSEKLAALGGLVSGVAHEVRTPLTIIATNLHVLDRIVANALLTNDFAALAKEVPQITNEVLGAIDRVQGLVKGLSRFAQAKPLTIESLLDPIVLEAIDLYAAANGPNTRVVSDLHTSRVVVVDKSQIQQIVINLIENAVQASGRDADVTVRTYADPHGPGSFLEVEDRGIGMTPETYARMFEPLFTTKPNGTGVGLTIVQRIVLEHNATIHCKSEHGRGTTFTIHFPGPPEDGRSLEVEKGAGSRDAREARVS